MKSSKRKLLLFGVVTGIVGSTLLVVFGSMSALGYSIMLGVFTIAVRLFFREQAPLSRIACLLSFNIHIMVARAIVAAFASLITGQTIYELSANPFTFWVVLILTTGVSALITVITVHFVPQKYLTQLASKTEYIFFYIIIAALANVYMISNGNVYIHDIRYTWLPLHQIITAATWFFATYVVAIMLGITTIVQERKEKLERDKIYKHIIESRSLAVFKVNLTKDKLLRVSMAGKKGTVPDVPYSKYSSTLLKKIIRGEDYEMAQFRASVKHLLEEYKKENTHIEYHSRATINDELRWLRSVITIAKDESTGDILAVMTITDDIHESKEKVTALQAEAEKDSLLSVYNKKATELYIKEHLEQKKTGALFMIDLDNFKAINDNFGHSYGDEVLIEVCNKIMHHFRSDDIIGRVGGDEFIVFIKNDTNKEHLTCKAKEIVRDVHKLYSKNSIMVELSCSIGIAITDTEWKPFEELYHNADLAMYSCKKCSKNGYVVYSKANVL